MTTATGPNTTVSLDAPTAEALPPEARAARLATQALELDRAGIAAASRSACSASAETPSHVPAAIGSPAHGNLRIGLTRSSTESDVDRLTTALPLVVVGIRARLDAP